MPFKIKATQLHHAGCFLHFSLGGGVSDLDWFPTTAVRLGDRLVSCPSEPADTKRIEHYIYCGAIVG